MKTRLFKTGAALLAMAVVFSLGSCQEKDYFEETPETEVNNEDPQLLDFATTQTVKLNVNYGASSGFVSTFEVFTENPLVLNANNYYELKSGLKSVAAGISVGGKINLSKVIPATAKELYIYTPDLFIPTLMHANISAGMADFSVVDLSISSNDNNTTRTLSNNTIDGYLTTEDNGNVRSTMDIDANYRPNYITETITVDAKYLNRITAAFPNTTAVTNKDYYKDALLHTYKTAEIKIAMIHGDASNSNTLSYFFYNGTPEEISTVAKSKMKEVVALPYAKLDKGLKVGDVVQLMYYDADTKKWIKEFPAGVTIGFMLRSNAFSIWDNNPYINTRKDVLYSASAFNNHETFKTHTIYFDAALATDDDTFVCFGFEDTKGGGDKDCNDVMFHMNVNPTNAIEKPKPLPEVNSRTSIENTRGILAFEDNWPRKGDYDLNDVVVKYESEVTYVKYIKTLEGKVQSETKPIVQVIKDKFTLLHSGASYKNGFAYKANISPASVKSVRINDAGYTPETDGNGFIINISNNVHDDLQTVFGADKVYTCTPKEFNVTMIFDEENNSILQDDFNQAGIGAPYNPFIISNGRAGHEIHLPGYSPTEKADQSLFGQFDDRSNENELMYAGPADTPYPFAINLAGVEEFKIPVETKPIDYSYPKYIDWVNSKLQNHLNWFEEPADVF
ncbi:LruC domain-containing protein [Bacteroides sp. 214]|uniref:LruC domain-containing protein n=1 Tax=Bacteroides sp. 214 TaxID=2302935 RepID=UPI0013D5CB5B|nr:LruC domain-containing protein [Bacteroides sp. 214]